MKKVSLLLSCVFSLLALTVIQPALVNAQMDSSYSSSPSQMPPTTMQNNNNASQVSISIQNMQFMPSEIDITPGSTVVWTNNDTVPHTSTSDENSADSWDSGMISPGSSFSKTFTTEGTFTYHCNIHPNMHGTIRVASTGPSQPSMSPEQSGNQMPDMMQNTPSEYSNQSSTQTDQSENQAQVTIQNFQFMPQETNVVIGTTVTWTNNDTTSHTTTSDDSNSVQTWDSGTLSPGQSFSETFTTPGEFTYHCRIHPNMHGIIRVFQNDSELNTFQNSHEHMNGMQRVLIISIPKFCRHFFPQLPSRMSFSY